MNRLWKSTAIGGALFTVLLSARTSSADEPSAHEQGNWQKHEYSFAFMGFTSTYSCDGLADKIKLLLIAAGARQDVKSLPGACAAGFGTPDKFARAELTFYTLAPLGTPAPVGTSAPVPVGVGRPPSDANPVEGTWRPVAFSDRSPRELSKGDCELVEQFRSTVLPMFTTRGVEDRTTCVPHQDSGSVISLRFESFSTVPRTSGRAQPGGGA